MCSVLSLLEIAFLNTFLGTQRGRSYLPHRFTKGELGSTKLITLNHKMTRLMGERKGVYVIYLHFNKAFDTVCYCVLVFKLGCHDLDG